MNILDQIYVMTSVLTFLAIGMSTGRISAQS